MAMYSSHPTIDYDGYIIKDISRHANFIRKYKSRIEVFATYIIEDHETSGSISKKFYGTQNYYWLINLANFTTNPFYIWPMDSEELFSYVSDKYGAGNEYAHHHYITNDGIIVESTGANTVSVSNYAHEEAINDENRKIKIIRDDYLPQVLHDYRQEILGK